MRIGQSTYRSIWLAVALLLAAGWAAYGLVGKGSSAFLAAMVIASIILGGGTALLLRPSRDG